MTFIIGSINGLGIWYPLFQILSGGLMFGSIFMATDPVTSPTTPFGTILYGLFLGILTVLFRFLTPYPEGVLTSILTMNMFVFIIDDIGLKARYNKKYFYFLLIPILIIITSSIIIGNSYNQKISDTDTGYNIISEETHNNIK